MRANPFSGQNSAGRPKRSGDGRDRAESTTASYVDCVLFGRRRSHPNPADNEPSPSQTPRATRPATHTPTGAPVAAPPAPDMGEEERT
jgi:hypothetical protein